MSLNQQLSEGWQDFVSGLKDDSSESSMRRAIISEPETTDFDFSPYHANIIKKYAEIKNFATEHVVSAIKDRLAKGDSLDIIMNSIEEMIGETEEEEAGIAPEVDEPELEPELEPEPILEPEPELESESEDRLEKAFGRLVGQMANDDLTSFAKMLGRQTPQTIAVVMSALDLETAKNLALNYLPRDVLFVYYNTPFQGNIPTQYLREIYFYLGEEMKKVKQYA